MDDERDTMELVENDNIVNDQPADPALGKGEEEAERLSVIPEHLPAAAPSPEDSPSANTVPVPFVNPAPLKVPRSSWFSWPLTRKSDPLPPLRSGGSEATSSSASTGAAGAVASSEQPASRKSLDLRHLFRTSTGSTGKTKSFFSYFFSRVGSGKEAESAHAQPEEQPAAAPSVDGQPPKKRWTMTNFFGAGGGGKTESKSSSSTSAPAPERDEEETIVAPKSQAIE